MQKLCQQKRSHVVSSQLLLIALFGLAPLRRNHDASVVPEHVQTVVLSEKGLGRWLDGCEIIEVEMKVYELTFRVGYA